MGWQPGQGSGTGNAPGRDGGLPRAFAHDGPWATAPPSAALVAALEEAAGADGSYEGADTDAKVGITRQWAAVESYAGARKLGSLRSMTREDSDGEPRLRRRADLPAGWDDSLIYEVAGALAMGPVSAGNLAALAWALGTRLPGVGRLLTDGTLTMAKARLVVQVFEPLDEAEAARAEALAVPELAGKTYFQVERLAWRAAVAVAPDVAERRRAAAERDHARVTVFREEAGTVGLSGRDLPAAEALSGHANVLARATGYESSGAFPGRSGGALQALAYLDLLNGVSAGERVAFARAAAADPPDGPAPDGPGAHGPDNHGPDNHGPHDHGPDGSGPDSPAPDNRGPDNRAPDNRGPDNRGPDDRAPDGRGPSGRGPDGSRPDETVQAGTSLDGEDPADPGLGEPDDDGLGRDVPGPGPSDDGPDGGGPHPSGRVVRPEIDVPLATLNREAERPGDNRLLGALDPALARDLVTAAARSPASRWEVTVVDQHGYAVGHGIARDPGRRHGPQPTGPPGAALPARVNITITETHLLHLAAAPAQPRPGAPPGHWYLTHVKTGDGYGTWVLTLPGGRELTVPIDTVPTHACDHRHQTGSYQPTARLRRLVQARDHECTFPTCTRPARESDFEHALPYDQGGRTDACNAGARSRRCHQVKQMPGWTVTQPKPGWHTWTTPTGRTYTQEPWRYPA